MQQIADAPPEASDLEKADVAVTQAIAPLRDTLPVRVLGALSDLSDQPPLIAFCAATCIAGIARGDRKMAAAGGRMLAEHLLATAIKSAIKARVVRTRPHLLVEQDEYRMHAGEDDAHPVNSFPSGHTAGAVAVACAVARDYPERRTAAYVLAGGAALMQIPRCAHYPSDVGAGVAVGVAAEALVHGVETLAARAFSRGR